MGEDLNRYDAILDQLHALLEEVDALQLTKGKSAEDDEAADIKLRQVHHQISLVKVQLEELQQTRAQIERLAETTSQEPEDIEEAIARILELTESREEAFAKAGGDSSPLPGKTRIQQNIPIDRATDDSLREQLRRRTEDLEVTVGATWFSRAGIILTLIGLGLGVYYLFPSLSPEIRVAVGLVSAVLLFGIGLKLTPMFPLIGRSLQALGLSAGYFTVCAVFFFPDFSLDAPKVGEDSRVGAWALAAYALACMAAAHQFRTQSGAITATMLGYYTACFPGLGHWDIGIAAGTVAVTIALSYLNPGWMILPKTSLVGALILFFFWHYIAIFVNSTGSYLTPNEEMFFLWGLFLVFNILILYPKRRGDPVLSLTNTLGFYGTYIITQPPLQPVGILEMVIVGFQYLSSSFYKRLRKSTGASVLTDSFTILGLMFTALGTLQLFEGKLLAAILATQALGFGLYARRHGFRWTFLMSALLFYAVALVMFVPFFPGKSPGLHLLSAAWILLCGYLLEARVFMRWVAWKRAVMLFVVNFFFWVSLVFGVPSYWLTLSFMGSGFFMLGSGIFSRSRPYRLIGITWIIVACLNLITNDLAQIGRFFQVIVFLGVGLGLVAASFWYSKFAKSFSEDSDRP